MGVISALIGGSVCALLVGSVVLSVHYSGDYSVHGAVGGDNAGPGIAALLHGDLGGYLERQPIIGLTSILLRVPAVGVASALGAGSLMTYKIGTLVCILPLALLAAWLLADRTLSPTQRIVRLLAVVVVIQSPITRSAIESGHPEGVLAHVLDVAAVLAAMQGRTRWAAVMLGLALATKESAAVAVAPVMIALGGRRREAAVIAGAIVLLLVCSGWLAEPSAFLRALHGEGHTHFLTPLSLLWPFGSPKSLADGGVSLAHIIPWGLARSGATLLTLAVVAVPAAGWYLRQRRAGASCDPLALLALLGVLRCVCDSTHEMYYYGSLLLTLAVWEAMRNRVPVLTALTSFGVSLLFLGLGHVPGSSLYILSTEAELALIIYLGRHALTHPERAELAGAASPTGAGRVLGRSFRWVYELPGRTSEAE